MSQISYKLNSVVERTHKLVELAKALQEHNDLLDIDNQSVRVALETSELKRKELEEKLRILQLAKSFDGSNEKTFDMKQKINEFVREIDKCIVLLKK